MSNATPQSSGTREEEVTFEPHELFFSRTDERGVVLFGNDVFLRTSHYPWEEMSGAPHKIVRHPDMPRAVFWILWEALKAGTPIGAYIKNRAKNGQPYWVFAIITPISGGYLSVRLKPLSELKPKVIEVYERIRAKENAEKLEPQASAALFLEEIKALGFRDYPTFMAHALSKEVEARNTFMTRTDNPAMTRYRNMLDALSRIEASSTKIVAGFANIKTSPINMGVVAAQMGQQALPLSVISQSFSDMIEEIRNGIATFVARADTVAAEIHDGLFVTCANQIQNEVIDIFEAGDDTAVIEAEGKFLSELGERYLQSGLQHMVEEITQFHNTCKRLTRTLSGLSVTSIIGQIESARIGQQGGGIDDIMRQLDGFQERTRKELASIQDDSNILRDALEHEIASARGVDASTQKRRAG